MRTLAALLLLALPVTVDAQSDTSVKLVVTLDRPSDVLGGYGEFAYGAFDRKTARGSIDLAPSSISSRRVLSVRR